MGRPRKTNKDLPPGLYCYAGRNCYIRMRGELKPVDLGTPDRQEALTIYWEFRRAWDTEQLGKKTEVLAEKLDAAAKNPARRTVAEYTTAWRKDRLPTLLKRNGKPLSPKTRDDYKGMLVNQVETYEPFTSLDIAAIRTKHVRQFLAQWMDSPSFYNYMKSLLSRVLQFAVDEGLLDANPTSDVQRRPVSKREVYCPMEDYMAITKKMAEWEARACDLVYLTSHRPGDVLRLQDREPWVRYATRKNREVVVVSFKASKNEQAVEIIDAKDREGGIHTVLEWFRQWKKNQNLVGHHIVVYPITSRRKSIGKPISVDYLSRRFAEASEAAGFGKGKYTLRDLRKKGLTDEARLAGKATNKGGHKTEEMREYYVVDELPQRARNNLAVLRSGQDGG